MPDVQPVKQCEVCDPAFACWHGGAACRHPEQAHTRLLVTAANTLRRAGHETLAKVVDKAHCELRQGTPPSRDQLGEMVRIVWVRWAMEQPNPKPSWLVPWEKLSEPDREVDRRIGAALYNLGRDIAVRAVTEVLHGL